MFDFFVIGVKWSFIFLGGYFCCNKYKVMNEDLVEGSLVKEISEEGWRVVRFVVRCCMGLLFG